MWEKVNPISLSISPFLVIDANTNQSKYIKCRIKPIDNITRYEWIAFFYLTFWTTFAPLVLFFANSFGKSFQSLFANSQRHMNKIVRSIFKI
jgi:hypothetical protein